MDKIYIRLFGSFLACSTALQAATITVTTSDNFSTAGDGVISLVEALQTAGAGDTIAFNIPGDGPHLLETPDGGYPLIRQSGLTIDGYTQPGSRANTNPIRAANNARVAIVLDSTFGQHTPMNYGTGQPGYDDSEGAILGVFNAANITIKGLCFLGRHGANDATQPAVYGVAFARDHNGAPNYDDHGHVAGCWFGVRPDGTTIDGGSAAAVAAFRHRDTPGGGRPELPNRNLTIGVKPGSANPTAEFNVMVDMELHVAAEATGLRLAGNFIGLLPDGKTPVDASLAPHFKGASVEVGRYANSTIFIGTDGDGVNDRHEGNIFGPLSGESAVLSFYDTQNKQFVIAGNYFGVAVDGVTPLTGFYRIAGTFGPDCAVRIGSDFNGVSDGLEANTIVNNQPFSTLRSAFNPIVAQAGAKIGLRGNVLVNNYPLPVNLGPTFDPEPDPSTFYEPHLVDDTVIVPELTAASANELAGSVPVAKSSFVATVIDLYLADPEGIDSGRRLSPQDYPNGFVQGRRYLRSFVEGSAADLDPAPGRFRFDVSGLFLGGGNYTVAASYLESAPGTANVKTVTTPFSNPIDVPFVPGGLETARLSRLVPDRAVFTNNPAANLDNWEPFASVVGTSTFVFEANTFAENSSSNQRYVVALQPVTGGAHVEGDAFFSDHGTPYRGQISSRQNGNPGRVAGDTRPGAQNFLMGGEAFPHTLPGFNSDGRWDLGFVRNANTRYGTVQAYRLDPVALTQTPISFALDAINGRLTTTPASVPDQAGRFGGDLCALDNGNFAVVINDRLNLRGSDNMTTAVILAPDGRVVTESFAVDNREIWSNVAPFQGGFCVRVQDRLYFYNNDGSLRGSVRHDASGVPFENNRGDGTRIAGHVNSPYVYLAGRATSGPAGVNVAVFDSRSQTFVTVGSVLEPAFVPNSLDRVNLAVDALNRVAVAFEAKPDARFANFQIMVRVLQFDSANGGFNYLSPSFLAFTNNGPNGFRTIRPTVAMTTRQILVGAKGEINSANQPANGPDTTTQTTFYTVFTHPQPAPDPTTPVGGVARLAISRSGNNVIVSWPTSSPADALVATASLSGNVVWQRVGTAPSIVNGNYQLTLPASPSQRFFALGTTP